MKTAATTPLKAARLRLGLTQAEAAACCLVAQSTYAGVESGRQNATLDLLHAYAASLGVDPHEIDPRLAPATPGRVLTLVATPPDAPRALMGVTGADDDLVCELLPNPYATGRSVLAILTAANAAGVTVVIRPA